MTTTSLASLDVAVSDVRASAYTVPTDAPEGDGTLTWDSTTLVLVQVTAGGTEGLGWTYGPPACADFVTGKLASTVEGTSALDVMSAYYAMWQAVRNAGRPGMASMAISAVDTALWDLKAKLLGLPLHRLFGAAHDEVPVYGSGGFTTYDKQQLTDQLEGWVSAGIPRVKIKIGESNGHDTARDVARVRQARRVIGDDVELFVDANGGYSPKQAVRLFQDVEDQQVRWFEEPVTSDDLEGLRFVREHVRTDVTAGEYGYTLGYFSRMLEAEAVDCLQIDVTRCGGYTEFLRSAAVAAAHHVDVSGHCAPNLRHEEYFHDHVRIESMLFDGTGDPRDGALTPSEEPGIGLQWRSADAERFRVK
jgi:L-alanine-DL-glutamate epimerase-like enolase superfamily enzyme